MMTELPHNQPPLGETGVQRPADAPGLLTHELQQPWRGDWGHEAALAPVAQPPVRRERLFSRKVLVGWALVTLALYFGVRAVGTAVKDSIRASVASRTSTHGPGRVTIILPNGRKIVIDNPGPAAPSTPAKAGTVPPASAPAAAPASKIPAALPSPDASKNPAPPSKK